VDGVIARRVRVLGLLVAVLAGATCIGYVGLIVNQGFEDDWGRVALVAVTIVVAGAAAAFGAFAHREYLRTAWLAGAAGVLMTLGYLALFSIGLVLVVCGLLAAGAAIAEVRAFRTAGIAFLSFLLGGSAVLVQLFLSA
jgi:hypothetical protein